MNISKLSQVAVALVWLLSGSAQTADAQTSGPSQGIDSKALIEVHVHHAGDRIIFEYGLLAGLSSPVTDLGSACSTDSAVALLELMSQFTMSAGALTSWDNATNPSTWDGVACDGEGAVASLNLSGRGLRGGGVCHLSIGDSGQLGSTSSAC